jgi:hypothetical protein
MVLNYNILQTSFLVKVPSCLAEYIYLAGARRTERSELTNRNAVELDGVNTA